MDDEQGEGVGEHRAVPSTEGAEDAGRAEPRTFTPTPYPRAAASHRAGKRRSAGRIAARTVIALLSVVALSVTAYAYTTVDDLQDNVNTTDALNRLEDGDAPAPPADDGATDILLVGIDARTDMQGNPLPLKVLKTLRTEQKAGLNTDTLIILRIPKDGGKPTAISIPRDTWVRLPSGQQGKINSVFGLAKGDATDRLWADGATDAAEVARKSDQAGRKALVRTVQNFTQVRIDHYAEINLLGFYLLTKALGGVKVCLNHPTKDKDSGADFAAGVQVLSGAEALSFVRQRKNLPRGGFDRIVRQQAFLASALHKVLSAGTLTNPDRLRELTEAVRRSVVLDPDLDLLEFAEQVKGIASGDVKFVTIPVLGIQESPGGLSIIAVDLGKVRQFVAGVVDRDSRPPAAGGGGGSNTAGGGGSPAGYRTQITADDVPCVN